jgi:uncharacterized protein YcnI
VKPHIALTRTSRAVVAAFIGLLAVPALALGHAEVSPAVSVSGHLQLYSLAVPTEKAGVTTSRIVLAVPSGFGIDSFAPPPAGWHQQVQSTGSGENAVVQKITWTGGRTPTGEDSLFQFLAQPASPRAYIFRVQQTYSDGSIVDWAGSRSSEAPAPTIEVKRSLDGGGGGTSVLTIIALVVGVLGLAAGGFALVDRRGGGGGGGGGRALV